MSVFEYIGSIGGVGGVLALLMFLAIRHLVRQMRDDRKYMEDRLTQVINSYNETTTHNTTVLTELMTWLKAKNGNR